MNQKRGFGMFLIAFLIGLFGTGTWALADEYETLVANSLHVMECPQSLNEAQPFECIPFSPYDFMQTIGDDVEKLRQVCLEHQLDPQILSSCSEAQAKLFTFWGVPFPGTPCDVAVIRYGCAPVYCAVLFLNINGEWMLSDVIPDVESVETMCGLTNTWLKIKTSAFSDGVQIERLYSLSSRRHEIHYVSRDSGPACDLGLDDVILLSAYSTICEYSTVDGSESVYACELYVVRNTSFCTLEAEAILEHQAATEIDLYTYDYENDRFVYLKTNRCDGIGAATIDSLLRKDLLVSDTQVIRP